MASVQLDSFKRNAGIKNNYFSQGTHQRCNQNAYTSGLFYKKIFINIALVTKHWSLYTCHFTFYILHFTFYILH